MLIKNGDKWDERVFNEELDYNFKDSIPTLFIDGMLVYPRIHDDAMLIQLFSNLPNKEQEQIRFMAFTKHLREFVDIFCDSLDYYPTKSKKNTVKGKTGKKQ